MTLTLYGVPRTRTSRTLWMFAETGQPYTLVRTAPADGQTRDPAFLDLNPMGQVPTLVDGDVVVFESLAINLHLARLAGAPIGARDLGEEARMASWTLWAATTLEPDAHEIVVHTINRPEAERSPAAGDAALSRLERPLRALEAALEAGNGYLVGGRFTVADLNVACCVFYIRAEPRALEPFARVKAWYLAATEREGFKTMMRMREIG